MKRNLGKLSYSLGAFAMLGSLALISACGKDQDFETRNLSASTLPVQRVVRVMPFGDSITSGISYRQPLWELLHSARLSRIDFVGSLHGNSKPDGDHEGHPCYKITSVLLPVGTGTFKKCIPNENSFGDARDPDVWFEQSTPDIVLWHIGTNDVLDGQAVDQILKAFSVTLTKLRQRNPNVTILVAQILPMSRADVSQLNAAIPQWAASRSTADSKIMVVDMHTGFNPGWTPDGVHPDATGNQWIAGRWLSALQPLLEAGQSQGKETR